MQGRSSTTTPLDPSRSYVQLFAANVVRLRGELGWTTRAFAEHAGLSLATLYELEHAVYKTVSIDTVEKLAKGFGVHPSYLLAATRTRRAPFPEVALRETLATNLLRARSARGWSQAVLAERAGVSRDVVVGVERRARNASLNVLERLGQAVGLTLPQMLSDA